MKSRGRLKLFAAVLAFALAPGSALFAQDYEIRLHRPDAVGSKYHLSVVGKESTAQLLKQGDKVLENKDVKFTVEGEMVVTVLTVNEKGKNIRVKLDVERLTRIEGDVRKELVPKGSVITASWDGRGQAFEMAGGALEPDTEESLKLLDLITDDPDGPTDDEIFGTKERKKVGDHWEGNAEPMAKDLTHLGLTVKKEDLKSNVTVEKVVKVGNTDCLQLNIVFTCDKFAPPLPAGFPVEKSEMKMNFTGKYPVETSLLVPAEGSTDMTMAVSGRLKPNPSADEIVFQMATDRNLTERVTEAK